MHLIIGLVNLGGNHDLLANQELFDELFKPVIERDKKRQMAQRKKSKDYRLSADLSPGLGKCR